MVDLPSYLRRIGHDGPVAPTLDTLRALHARHPAAIAFESLDPFLGRPVSIDPATVRTKLVGGARGGYCHEHNLLFHDVLAAIGFRVTALGARVAWMAQGRINPRTHRLTLVDLPEGRFLADVGFGGQTPTAPLRLVPGEVQPTPHGTYRVVADPEGFALEMRIARDRWEPLYRFSTTPQPHADFEVANWFTGAHPRSRFVANLIAAIVRDDRRINLLNADLAIRHPDGRAEQRRLDGPANLAAVLEGTMGIALPAPAEELWVRLPAVPVPPWP